MTNINDLSQAVAQHLDRAAASARALAEEADVQHTRGDDWKAKAAERRRQLAEALHSAHLTPWESLIEYARDACEGRQRYIGYLNDARDAAGAQDWPSLPDTVRGIVNRANDAEKRAATLDYELNRRTVYQPSGEAALDAEQRLAKAKARGDHWKAKAAEMEADRDRADKALADAEERARKATASALNLRTQTENAAHATLDRIRASRAWSDVWAQLGMYYGMKPEECGQEARARREGGTIANLADAEQRVRAAKCRADEAEAEAERCRVDYERACKQITDMHRAAVGETTGPIRGVVEDIADLRERAEQADANRDRADRAERQIKAAHERAGEAARNLRTTENNLGDERRKTRQLIERAHRAEGALDHVAAERDRYREQAEANDNTRRYVEAAYDGDMCQGVRDDLRRLLGGMEPTYHTAADAEPVGTVEPDLPHDPCRRDDHHDAHTWARYGENRHCPGYDPDTTRPEPSAEDCADPAHAGHATDGTCVHGPTAEAAQ